jgi:hypothetical protein
MLDQLRRLFPPTPKAPVSQRWIGPSPYESPTRRPLDQCEKGYLALLEVPSFWEGRAKIRREVIQESQHRLDEQSDEWLRISLSAQRLKDYEKEISPWQTSSISRS